MIIVSPGVYAREIDFSTYAPALATSICGMVGTASKGPTDEITLITDEATLVKTFGMPAPDHLAIYAAVRYLKRGRQLKFVRVADYDAAAVVGIRNESDTAFWASIEAVSTGSWGNNISVVTSLGMGPATAKLTVLYNSAMVEVYDNMVQDAASANYVGTRINGVSEYITISIDALGGDPGVGTWVLTGGVDGTPVSAADIIGSVGSPPVVPATGLQLFANPETIDVNLLCVPGRTEASIIAAIQTLCETRGDCFGLIDTPYGLTVSQAVAWHNGLGGGPTDPTAAISSSYLALYYPWLQVYDGFNDVEVWVPPVGHIAGVCAYTDFVADPWWAPAGLNRARLSDVLQVHHSATQGERDYMYADGNCINPIINYHSQGIVVWGQRTAQRVASALDRINVRRMMLYLRKVVATATLSLVMEPNDEATWDRFVGLVDPLCEQIKARRGIYDYRVICDATTNPPAVIDRNEMVGRILVQPTKTAEMITLEFTLLASGASFEEA